MAKNNQAADADWLNSCLDQSLATTSWKKAESKACAIISEKLAESDLNSSEKQSVLQVLGKELVDVYFAKEKITDDSWDSKKGKHKKKQEAMRFVLETLDSYSEKKKVNTKKNKFPELSTFQADAKSIVDSDLARLQKQKLKKNIKESINGTSLALHLLHQDNTMVKHLCIKFLTEATALPDRLRLPIWIECLCNIEKPKKHESFIKEKKKYSQSSKKGNYSGDLDIQSAVEEVCHEIPFMRKVSSEEGIQFTTDVIALYNGYNKKIPSNCIFWALPMSQLFVFQKHTDDNSDSESEDDSVEDAAVAAFILEKLLQFCVPNGNQLFAVVSHVMEAVEKQDKEIVDYLRKVMTINVPPAIKDFSPSILSLDKKKALKMEKELKDSKSALSEETMSVVIQPEIYIRKWIFEGFVNVLECSALLFLWDQLFLNHWSQQLLQKICMDLLGLLKPWFMIASDFSQVRKVFLEEPSLLYTYDIIKVYRHTKKKYKFSELGHMNRNIIPGKKPLPKPVILSPPPLPIQPPIPSPPQPVEPSPLPQLLVPSPPKNFIPWVLYDKGIAKSQMPAKTKVDHPFDIYVDAVRFLPDNATLVKVTGKLLNIYLQQKDVSVKLHGLPILDSPARYPQFTIKETINQSARPINPDVVLMLRLYTVENHSKKQTVIGSCLFCPFSNKQGKQATLRVGGHQLRMRHGIPDPEFTVEHLLSSHMDNNPLIPGLTILIRILPRSKDYIEAPQYEDKVYRSEFARPNDSEKRLFSHYQKSKDFDLSVREIALPMIDSTPSNDNALIRMISEMFDKEGSHVQDFPYQRFVNYKQEAGMLVLADKASGLPMFLDGRYLQCLVQYYPGEETKVGSGKSQVKSFMTEKLDLESLQRAPDWIDTPTRLTLQYDDKAFLVVTLYGLRPRFDPKTKQLVGKDNKEPTFEMHHAIAWSAIPCFDKGAVFAGTHHVPLLKGRPTEDILDRLRYLPFDYFCKKFKTSVKVFDAASIEITLWDGHFAHDESPPVPVHLEYLNISPNPKKYLTAKEHAVGATVGQLIHQAVPNSERSSAHQKDILQLLAVSFKKNMNHGLEQEGYSPLL